MSIEVNVSGLENEAKNDLGSFIEGKLSVKATRDGDIITLEDKSERTHVPKTEVKTYLKRFLHQKKLRKKYRVLSEEGALTFVKLKLEEGEEEQKEE